MWKIKRWQSRHLTDRRGSGTRSDTSQAPSWPRVNLSAAGSLGHGGTGGGGGGGSAWGLKAAVFTEHFVTLAASTTVLVCGSLVSALAMMILVLPTLWGYCKDQMS